jgi:uncharacterized glyoxalase superfamily protein PhnB
MVPHLVVKNAAAALEFYKKAFGFEEVMRMPTPDGRILHSTLKRGDYRLFVVDEFPDIGVDQCRNPLDLGGTSVTIHLGSTDVDAEFAKAVAAGAKAVMPPKDMFWGDRYGKLIDPFGHHWSLSTHERDVSPEEAKRAADAMFRKK